MSKYLFIGAHCDEELCFAGTMVKFLERGDDVEVLFLSYCDSHTLKNECIAAGEILGVMPMLYNFPVRCFRSQPNKIADILHKLGHYDTVFTHSVNDRHPDHKTVAQESLRVFNCNLITYVGPWNENENPNYLVELSEHQLATKQLALNCYKTQAHRPYFNPDFIRSWTIYNGIKAGVRYAEGFHSQRLIV